jgi:membrane-associated phospholipid phosphatase
VTVAGGSEARARAQRRLWRYATYANLEWGIAVIARRPRSKALPRNRTGRYLLGVALAAAAIIATMVLFDASVAEAVRNSPWWVLFGFREVTDFGKSGWFLWPSGVVLLAIASAASAPLPRLSRFVLAMVAVRVAFLFTAIALPSLVVTIAKRLIGRARPFVGGHVDPFLYMPPIWRPDYASMPSGHATTAFAAAVAVALLWPRLRIPMLVYAVLIAASRVVLDAHYLSDVIAGAAAGVVGALVVRDWFAARRLGFAIDADGRICRLPGPSFARLKRVVRTLLAP